jgi:BlaI family transcriptional regulator, penicillinase repressor
MSPNPNPQLTPLQLSVLRVLWERGEARVAEVRAALKGSRELAQNTVATILSRLEKQGLVAHESEGRQFVYRAVLAPEEAEQSMVGELTERVFAGDYGKLFSHLLERDEVDADELAKVRALIDARLDEEGR